MAIGAERSWREPPQREPAVSRPLLTDPWDRSARTSAPVLTAQVERCIWVISCALVGAGGPFIWLLASSSGSTSTAFVLLGASLLVSASLVVPVVWPGMLVVAFAGLNVVATEIGWMRPALTIAAVLIACGASGRLPLAPGRPVRETSTAALSFPFLLSAAVLWNRSPSIAAPAAAVLISAGVLVVYRSAPSLSKRAESAIARATRAVVRVVGGAAVLLCAVVVLYVPGAVLNVWRIGRANETSTRWTLRSSSPDRVRRDARVPFASPEPAIRTRRAIGGLLVAIAPVMLLVWGVSRSGSGPEGGMTVMGSASPSASADRSDRNRRIAQLEAADDLEYFPELLQEQTRIPLPVDAATGYRLGEFASRYTNVENGRRRTVTPSSCERCPSLDVWIVGGSAAFGQGQRDGHTVASDLVRLAERDGRVLNVRNLGVPGWTLWQEHQGLLRELGATGEPPDVVVFYDGFNDVLFSLAAEAGSPQDWSQPVVFDPDRLERFLDGGVTSIDAIRQSGGAQTVGRKAADRISRLRAAIETELRAEGISVLNYFQADAASSTRQRPAISISEPRMTPDFVGMIDAALETATRALGDEDVRTRNLLDADRRALFFDVVHHNEAGAEVVASDLYGVLLGNDLLATPRHRSR